MTPTTSTSVNIVVTPAPTATRDPALWPFTYTSPWNYPIGSNAIYTPAITSMLGGTPFTGCQAQARGSIWIPISSDPLRNIIRDDRPTGPNHLRVQNVPDAAVPADDSDRALGFISLNHLLLQDVAYATKIGVDWHTTGALTDVDLKGRGYDLQTINDGSTSAAGWALSCGIIRGFEMAQGKIPHAIYITSDPQVWNKNTPGYLGGSGAFTWPAASSDDPTPFGTIGNCCEGGLCALLPSFNVASLVTSEAQTIATALKNYGGYFGDSQNGIFRTLILNIDTATAKPYFPTLNGAVNALYIGTSNSTAFDNDVNTIAAAMQIVTNSNYQRNQVRSPGIKLDLNDGAINQALIAPVFAAQWGGGQ